MTNTKLVVTCEKIIVRAALERAGQLPPLERARICRSLSGVVGNSKDAESLIDIADHLETAERMSRQLLAIYSDGL